MYRAPQILFDAYKDASEADRLKLRQQVFEWLSRQKSDKKALYIVPDPNTGEEMFISRQGVKDILPPTD